MATEVRYSANIVINDNHTAPGTLTERSVSVKINSLLIKNTHATSSAFVSFDGTTFVTLNPGQVLTVDESHVNSYWTASSGGVAGLEVLIGGEK